MQRLDLRQLLSQKLSPQQIQFIKLLQIPTAELEMRIKEELEINPALEEGREVVAVDGDAALDERGFIPRQWDSAWHLKPRTSADALQVEVHLAVTGFDSPSAVPWADCRPISCSTYWS